MIEISQVSILDIKVYDEKIAHFRAAMASIYKEINKPGFNKDILTRKQREVFNEVVEEMAHENEQSADS